MITVIAPHARPEFSANLLANFRRQRGVEAQLLVVENGLADMVTCAMQHGAWGEQGTIIRSEPHQADAMNAGLAWLRTNGGGGAWARFDDDDYYGPEYLAGVVASFDTDDACTGLAGHYPVVVSGMPWRFVMLDDGLHQFQGHGEFTGGSLAASTTDVASFERHRDDDIRWCLAMRGSGACFVERAPQGYCYDRTTRSAPRVIEGGSAVTRFGFGPSLFYGPQALSAVDRTDLTSLCERPFPSNEEIFAEMSTT